LTFTHLFDLGFVKKATVNTGNEKADSGAYPEKSFMWRYGVTGGRDPSRERLFSQAIFATFTPIL
jgi:hypothetical protein